MQAATKQDIALLEKEVGQEFKLVRLDILQSENKTENEFRLVRQNISMLENKMEQEFKLVRSEIRNSTLTIIISLAGIFSFIVTFSALLKKFIN